MNKNNNNPDIIMQLFAKAENIEEIDKMISNNILPISVIDKNNNTLLHHIFKNNSNNITLQFIDAIKFYIKKDIPINHINNNNEAIIHLALKTGNTEIVKSLIDMPKINLFIKDINNNYPIHYVFGQYKNCPKVTDKFILEKLNYNDVKINTTNKVPTIFTAYELNQSKNTLSPSNIIDSPSNIIDKYNKYNNNIQKVLHITNNIKDNYNDNIKFDKIILYDIKWDTNSYENKIVYNCLFFNITIFNLLIKKNPVQLNLRDNNNLTIINKLINNNKYNILEVIKKSQYKKLININESEISKYIQTKKKKYNTLNDRIIKNRLYKIFIKNHKINMSNLNEISNNYFSNNIDNERFDRIIDEIITLFNESFYNTKGNFNYNDITNIISNNDFNLYRKTEEFNNKLKDFISYNLHNLENKFNLKIYNLMCNYHNDECKDKIEKISNFINIYIENVYIYGIYYSDYETPITYDDIRGYFIFNTDDTFKNYLCKLTYLNLESILFLTQLFWAEHDEDDADILLNMKHDDINRIYENYEENESEGYSSIKKEDLIINNNLLYDIYYIQYLSNNNSIINDLTQDNKIKYQIHTFSINKKKNNYKICYGNPLLRFLLLNIPYSKYEIKEIDFENEDEKQNYLWTIQSNNNLNNNKLFYYSHNDNIFNEFFFKYIIKYDDSNEDTNIKNTIFRQFMIFESKAEQLYFYINNILLKEKINNYDNKLAIDNLNSILNRSNKNTYNPYNSTDTNTYKELCNNKELLKILEYLKEIELKDHDTIIDEYIDYELKKVIVTEQRKLASRAVIEQALEAKNKELLNSQSTFEVMLDNMELYLRLVKLYIIKYGLFYGNYIEFEASLLGALNQATIVEPQYNISSTDIQYYMFNINTKNQKSLTDVIKELTLILRLYIININADRLVFLLVGFDRGITMVYNQLYSIEFTFFNAFKDTNKINQLQLLLYIFKCYERIEAGIDLKERSNSDGIIMPNNIFDFIDKYDKDVYYINFIFDLMHNENVNYIKIKKLLLFKSFDSINSTNTTTNVLKDMVKTNSSIFNLLLIFLEYGMDRDILPDILDKYRIGYGTTVDTEITDRMFSKILCDLSIYGIPNIQHNIQNISDIDSLINNYISNYNDIDSIYTDFYSNINEKFRDNVLFYNNQLIDDNNTNCNINHISNNFNKMPHLWDKFPKQNIKGYISKKVILLLLFKIIDNNISADNITIYGNYKSDEFYFKLYDKYFNFNTDLNKEDTIYDDLFELYLALMIVSDLKYYLNNDNILHNNLFKKINSILNINITNKYFFINSEAKNYHKIFTSNIYDEDAVTENIKIYYDAFKLNNLNFNREYKDYIKNFKDDIKKLFYNLNNFNINDEDNNNISLIEYENIPKLFNRDELIITTDEINDIIKNSISVLLNYKYIHINYNETYEENFNDAIKNKILLIINERINQKNNNNLNKDIYYNLSNLKLIINDIDIQLTKLILLISEYIKNHILSFNIIVNHIENHINKIINYINTVKSIKDWN